MVPGYWLYLELEWYDYLLQYTQQGYKSSQHFAAKAAIVGLSGLLMDVFVWMDVSDLKRYFSPCLLEHADWLIQSVQDIHHYFQGFQWDSIADLSNLYCLFGSQGRLS